MKNKKSSITEEPTCHLRYMIHDEYGNDKSLQQMWMVKETYWNDKTKMWETKTKKEWRFIESVQDVE